MNILRPLAIAPLLLALLFCACPAHAHQGFESDALIRLLPAETFVIVRMTPSVASALLGPDAPAAWNEAFVTEHQPRLQELAVSLLVVSAGNQALSPEKPKVVLEVDGHLAFVLRYPPAPARPLRVEAAFFRSFGPEFTGSLHVYGPPENPGERQGPEIAALELSARDRVLQIP